MGWMDVIVVVILAINAIKGWMKGFILTIFHMIEFIVAWIIAKSYYKLFSAYLITHTNIFSAIEGVINRRLKNSANEEGLAEGIATDYDIFEGLKLPKAIEEFMKSDNVITDYGTRAMDGVYQYMAEIFSKMFIDLICFFIIFMGVKLIMTILGYLLNGIGKLPILRQFNCLGGGIVGVFKGFLIVFIVLALLIPIVTISENEVLLEGMEKSIFTKYIYDHNPLIDLLEDSVPLEDPEI